MGTYYMLLDKERKRGIELFKFGYAFWDGLGPTESPPRISPASDWLRRLAAMTVSPVSSVRDNVVRWLRSCAAGDPIQLVCDVSDDLYFDVHEDPTWTLVDAYEPEWPGEEDP